MSSAKAAWEMVEDKRRAVVVKEVIIGLGLGFLGG